VHGRVRGRLRLVRCAASDVGLSAGVWQSRVAGEHAGQRARRTGRRIRSTLCLDHPPGWAQPRSVCGSAAATVLGEVEALNSAAPTLATHHEPPQGGAAAGAAGPSASGATSRSRTATGRWWKLSSCRDPTMTLEANFTVVVLYRTLALYDRALENPFNDWTREHWAQGFSWRPGSVSS